MLSVYNRGALPGREKAASAVLRKRERGGGGESGFFFSFNPNLTVFIEITGQPGLEGMRPEGGESERSWGEGRASGSLLIPWRNGCLSLQSLLACLAQPNHLGEVRPRETRAAEGISGAPPVPPPLPPPPRFPSLNPAAAQEFWEPPVGCVGVVVVSTDSP